MPNQERSSFAEADLLAYLDEMLPVDQASAFEQALRSSPEMQRQLANLLRKRDQGGYTVGEIWRRQNLSCPDRHELGSYLLGILEEDRGDYIDFHLRVIGCRICQSNLDDLRASQESGASPAVRRAKFFESSAGVLRSRREE